MYNGRLLTSPIIMQQQWPHAASSSSPLHSTPSAAPGNETLKSVISSGFSLLPPHPSNPILSNIPLQQMGLEFHIPSNPKTQHKAIIQPTACQSVITFTCWRPEHLFHHQNIKFRPNNEICCTWTEDGNRGIVPHFLTCLRTNMAKRHSKTPLVVLYHNTHYICHY